jgi:heme exporter protein B
MPPDFLRSTWLVARKDLAIEFRTRSAFFSAVVFALLAIVVFYFAWDRTTVGAADLAPGVLWVIFIFSGLLGLNRSFALETQDRALDALLVAPVPREAIFAGKALANFLFVLGVQAVAIPAVFIIYTLPLDAALGAVAALGVVAAIGLVAVGTLFSAMVSNTRLAELLLPMLALPFYVPIVMAAAQSTSKLLAGRPVAEAAAWLKLLLAFDIVFVAACVLIFPYTLEE